MLSRIIGQHSVWSQLNRFVAQDKVPHAMLFSGEAGRGGLTIAIAFAQLLLCENRTDDKACGSCPQCHKSMKLIHPDLHFSFPVIKAGSKDRKSSFSDDFLPQWRDININQSYFSYFDWLNFINAAEKQGDINVTECNEISKKLSLKSYGGGRKILILWLPEFLGNNSNRLLKLIEEPPDDTHIIFVTHDENVLLKTIKSRFQIIKLPPIEIEELSQNLGSRFDLDEVQSQRIALLSQGNYLDAKSMISGENTDVSDLVLRWLRVCYQMKASLLNEWVEEFGSASKEFQKQILSYALFILREFIKLSASDGGNISLSEEEYAKLKGLTNVLSLSKAEEIANIIDDAIYAIQRNANVRIMMMADSMTIGQVLRRKNISLIHE